MERTAPAKAVTPTDLEAFFQEINRNVIGHDYRVSGPSGGHHLLYADWIASGRLYGPIEDMLSHRVGPLLGNTHSESSLTGEAMTIAYKEAQRIIKHHCHAGSEDVIITEGSGMTGAIAKLFGSVENPRTSKLSSHAPGRR